MRVALLGQLARAQLALEAAIADLRSSGGGSALLGAEARLGEIIALRSGVATADSSTLARLREEVKSMVATSSDQARDAQAAASAQASERLADAREGARRAVKEVMDGMRDFDPYLRFSSAEDERAYRDREAQRRAYIEEEQKKGTVQGELNAANAAIAQMDDAKAHGADHSPEFARRLRSLTDAKGTLEERAGKTPSPTPRAAAVSNEPENHYSHLADAMEALRAAGVQPSQTGVPASGHGLDTQPASAPQGKARTT